MATGDSLNLCGLCYAEGKYPTGLNSGDFSKLDVASLEHGMRVPWTDEETLMLLSAIEEFANDWDSVAQKVGRPKDQCVFQFLRLPGIETIDAQTTDAIGAELAKNTHVTGSIPFATAANPIMSTLAFLASAVHPKVAAAAAQAALAEVVQMKSEESTTSEPPTSESLAQVSAAGLACASARSSIFADEESKKACRLRDTLVDLQLQKLRVKMALFEDLERSLDEDRKELEQQRLQLFFDRFNLRKQMMAIENKAGLEMSMTSDRMEIDETGEAGENGENGENGKSGEIGKSVENVTLPASANVTKL
jgi:SWI/SNF related-matrix-associated actin-dependent regulator of chromatin subfamily C